MKHSETLYCELYDYTCKISRNLAQFLLNSSILYCASISRNKIPYITPQIYVYHMNSCLITFFIPKNSHNAKNFKGNPFITLTNDIVNKKDPTYNNGIMIEAVATFNRSEKEMEETLYCLRKRYSSFDVPELVDKFLKEPNNIKNKYILVNANILKVIYWEGPVVKKEETLLCPARNYLYKQSFIDVEIKV